MSKSRSIPEELIKIKADQIGKKRESQGKVKTPEVDLVIARQYLEKHWWEVFCWQVNTLPGKLIIIGVIAFILCAYVFHWSWTGFVKDTTTEVTRESKTETSSIEKFTKTTKDQSAKTLWDWLELFGTLAVPILIAGLAYQFQRRDKERERKRAEQQANLEREIAKNNLAEEAIQAYLKSMAEILLDEGLTKKLFPDNKSNSSDNDNSVRDIARTLTITILRRLELEGDKERQERQERIIAFLKDAKLYPFIFIKAHLSEINLSGAYLRTNLQQAYLKKANLLGADLKGANLHGAVLLDAKITPKQIKSACNWEKAIYKGEWHWEEETETWVANNEQAKQDNTKYIEKLKKDYSSDPKVSPVCSIWKR